MGHKINEYMRFWLWPYLNQNTMKYPLIPLQHIFRDSFGKNENAGATSIVAILNLYIF